MKAHLQLRHARGKGGRRRGIALLEATVGLGGLVVISLLLLKAGMSATMAQRWTVVQGMTDSFMTTETALAKRVPFEELNGVDSRWPEYPTVSDQAVEVGRLPGGVPLVATLKRTRVPDTNNFALAGGGGTIASNPSKMEIWRLQSVLTYSLGNREYAKSRTVVRSR
ncbi:MAG: hypothetical protein KDM91_05560 [Verrucomicrobiae bacterium]|nr:hypothetical protein [Verrucomicrobiae bacterium]MCP5540520.1 hypothetical protein [Akkermansiaceae bacterium]MCP5550784.1 hypothetical protein [Akkermansiaceae bacterium]